MTGLLVVKSGMLSLLQDCGRFGVARYGLSCGGPVDLHAFCWANHILGNATDATMLEITMGNATFVAQCDLKLAITGAETAPTVDGKPLKTWGSFWLYQGQSLKLGYPNSGLRTYLAVSGGFAVEKVFGSSATVTRNKTGGLSSRPGSPLQKGDILPTKPEFQLDKSTNSVPRYHIPHYRNELCLGVIESYQADLFARSAKQTFYSNSYMVSDKLDRMGVRLQGKPVEIGIKGIISEGIALGAIQFPANGQPIILLNDRQTLGGYPKIGCISKMSLMKLAQARPGSLIQFYRADIDQETKRFCQFAEYFGLGA